MTGMSAGRPERPTPPDGWIDELRESLWNAGLSRNEDGSLIREGGRGGLSFDALEAECAYDAPDEPDAASIIAWFDGALDDDERRAFEARAAESADSLQKVAALGERLLRLLSHAAQPAPANSVADSDRLRPTAFGTTVAAAARPSTAPGEDQSKHCSRSAGCVLLPVLTQSEGATGSGIVESAAVRSANDPYAAVRRIRERGREYVRMEHSEWPTGTMAGIRVSSTSPGDFDAGRTSAAPDASPSSLAAHAFLESALSNFMLLQFVVFRPAGSELTVARLPLSTELSQCAVFVAWMPVPPQMLAARDAARIQTAWEAALRNDPAATQALDGPESPWKIWAEAVATAADVDPAVAEAAARIAAADPRS